VDVTEALEILRRKRIAPFDQVALAADGPGLRSGPQQGTAKAAVIPAGHAGAGVQTDRQPRKRTKLGEDLGDVQRR
jgi:hypothetical protein